MSGTPDRVTTAQLEKALLALSRRLAAVEQQLADLDADRRAAAERERRQQLRDELAARRHPLDLRGADPDQRLGWGRQVDRAVDGYRGRQAG
jgi:hypothetical protein